MSCHISFRDVKFTPSATQVKIVATTDTASHLWLRWTDVHPRIHYQTERRRGTAWMTDLRFCFDVFTDIEQDEGGDTLTHTWTIADWPYCTTKYFYLYGSISGEKCVSTSPTFRYHNDYVQVYDTGDFLSLFEQREYWGTVNRVLNVTQAHPHVWFIFDHTNQGLFLNTFSCTDDGDISDLPLDHVALVAGNIRYCSAAVEVSAGVYAFLVHYKTGSTYYGIVWTFKINPDGSIAGIQGGFTFAVGSSNIIYPQGETPLNVPGTDVYLWAAFMPGGWRVRLVAFHINAAGTSVTWAGSYISGNLGSQFTCDVKHISGSRYVVFIAFQNKEVYGYIFNVTNTGTISYISNYQIDSANGGGSWPLIKSVHVSGSVYALAYYRGGVPAYRVRTLAINPDGSLGAVLDTNDGLYSQYSVYQFSPVSGNAFMLSCGGSGGLKLQTVQLMPDGSIAGSIDVCTWFSGFHVLTEYSGTGALWCACIAGPSPTHRLYGASHAVQM